MDFYQSVDECNRREYEIFRKQFTLSSAAVEIGNVLEHYPDVPLYYAELVPAVMAAEEFWSRCCSLCFSKRLYLTTSFPARYFFKLKLLLRGAAKPLDVLDEDEEIGWENNDTVGDISVTVDADVLQPPSSASSQVSLSSMAADPEKDVMRKQIRVLVARVSELERSLAVANEELTALRARKSDTDASLKVAASELSRSLPPSSEQAVLESSPVSDTRESSVVEVGSSVLSPFECESNTDTDTSNQGTRKRKSDTSLANLDNEEWEEEESSWS